MHFSKFSYSFKLIGDDDLNTYVANSRKKRHADLDNTLLHIIILPVHNNSRSESFIILHLRLGR